MVDAYIRSMIGTWGNAILDFYIVNNFWINAIILIYTLVVILSRRSFDLSLQSLIITLQNQHGEQITKKGPGGLLGLFSKTNIPWTEALAKSPLPFITPPGSIRLYPKNIQTFQRFITLEKLVNLVQQKRTP